MAWRWESFRRIAGDPIVAVLPWSLIWQDLGGLPWPRCSVAPGNLSNIGKPNFYGRVPHCIEFDSGGNGVRETSRTGLPWLIPAMSTWIHWLGYGNWPSFKSGAPLDTNVQCQLQQQQNFVLFTLPLPSLYIRSMFVAWWWLYVTWSHCSA